LPAAFTGGMLVGMAQKRKSTAKKVPAELRNRAFFELGLDFEQLLDDIEHEYLLAREDTEYDVGLDSLVAQINTELSTLADGFRGTNTAEPLRDLREASDKAWRQFRREWLGKKHLAFVWARENTEPDLRPHDWWERNSPLKHKEWRQFREALAHLAGNLAELDETLLTTGQLMIQVLNLPRWPRGADSLLGESFPLPALQAKLLKLQNLLDLKIDVELRPALTQPMSYKTVHTSLERIHRDLLKHISQTKSTNRHRKKRSTGRTSSNKPANGPVQSNGPVAPYWFWWNGQRYEVQQPLIWRLIDFLWQAATRSAEFEELAEHVWQDHAALMGEAATNSARTKARKFFQQHDIPLTVRVIDRRFVLEETVEQ
jgi:hypothetical protein